MNSVGRSTATAPMAATCPALPLAKIVDDAAITQVQTNAATSAPKVSSRWTARRSSRGAKASTSTPMTAAPKTTSIGASWLYSMLGAVIAPGVAAATAATTRLTAGFHSGQLRGGRAPDQREPTWDMVALTAGLITSSTGLG